MEPENHLEVGCQLEIKVENFIYICTRNFGGRFYFYFSLVFCILEAFLTKQLFHWLLWNYDYSQLGVAVVAT